MSRHELTQDVVRAELERLRLDPNGVDLEWIAHVKYDTERHIEEHKESREFTATLVISAEPPSE